MKDKFTIFLVDDSPSALSVIEEKLNKFDVLVHSFEKPEKALEEMPKYKPDLILLDFNMPEFNGDQFMVKISEKLLFGDVSTFLVSSSRFNDEEKFGMLTLGIEKIFAKPIDDQEFENAIEQKMSEWAA